MCLTPFFAPLFLLCMQGKSEIGCALLINAAFALFSGVSDTVFGGMLLTNHSSGTDSFSCFSGRVVITSSFQSSAYAIVYVIMGAAGILAYGVPQLLFGIKTIREANLDAAVKKTGIIGNL